jgi:L-aspartate oxidase
VHARAAQRVPDAGERTDDGRRQDDAAASQAEWTALRDEMYANVGVERDGERLAHAVGRFETVARETGSEELRDAASVAALVAAAALERRESRGSHQRTDFRTTASAQQHRSFVTPGPARGTQRSA